MDSAETISDVESVDFEVPPIQDEQAFHSIVAPLPDYTMFEWNIWKPKGNSADNVFADPVTPTRTMGPKSKSQFRLSRCFSRISPT